MSVVHRKELKREVVLYSTMQYKNEDGKSMIDSIKNQQNKKIKTSKIRILPMIAIFCLIIFPSINMAAAQTSQSTPPQIPNYNFSSDEQSNLNITIPDQPSNPGVPQSGPSNPTSTPSQPDYTLLIIVIILVVIAAGILMWRSRKKTALIIKQ